MTARDDGMGGAVRHVEGWLDAWNRHDLDAIVASYEPDVRFNASTVATRWSRPDGWLTGHAELREHFARGLAAAPDLSFTMTDLRIGPAGYLLDYVRDNGNTVREAVALSRRGLAEHVLVFYDLAQR